MKLYPECFIQVETTITIYTNINDIGHIIYMYVLHTLVVACRYRRLLATLMVTVFCDEGPVCGSHYTYIWPDN